MNLSEHHKTILDHLTTAVVLLNQNLCVDYMNPAAESLLSSSVSQLNGMDIKEILQEDEISYHTLSRSLETQHPYTKREAQIFVNPSNQTLIADYTVTPLSNPDHSQTLLIELTPIDRLLRISREDTLKNNHAATRALIRGVAHEVKNPLGGILGAAQLLARCLPNQELQDYTDVIIAETDRLRNLVDRMLGPRHPFQKSTINVHRVLEHVSNVVSVEHTTVQIDRDYDPSIPDIDADQDQLIQATLNIVQNAVQALIESETPNPTIQLRTRTIRQFTIGSTRHRLVVAISIIDNGPGIPDELQETLFFPMVSGRANGTGLGLSIAQSIIDQHDGLIEFHSEAGQTEFRLLIPLEQTQ